MNVHAGINKRQILKFVENSEKVAQITKNQVWVFFDEMNTSTCLGMISELLCSKRLNGTTVSSNLRFLAAVNPYRLRTGDIKSVGLQAKLNTIDPLKRLVYRVYPLPQKISDYIWDFGQLHDKDEHLYIRNMLSDCLIPHVEVQLVAASQTFIRNVEEDCSVSLRDVRRYKKLVHWFYSLRKKRTSDRRAKRSGNMKDTAIVLALAFCYLFRLQTHQKRKSYLRCLHNTWESCRASISSLRKKSFRMDPADFLTIVETEQRYFIDKMHIPDHLGAVALNNSILENVFVLLVCIVNKIPVFLVGKPGCSKSLSLQLIFENLRGIDSPFPDLPCIYEQRYQCSEDSTSDGIEAIFDVAKRKAQKDGSSVTHVVVLDEIGLAEVSKHNPLKVLHDRLEPDTRYDKSNDTCTDDHELLYAVVGISNWSLDMSKMNRVIILTRPDPDKDDLRRTATAIVDSINGRIGISMKHYHEKLLHAISKAYFKFKMPSNEYQELVRTAFTERGNLKFDSSLNEIQDIIENFHGLRDFYALSRAIGAMTSPDTSNVRIAVARNFNGLPGSETYFQNLLLEEGIFHSISPLSTVKLICENIRDPRARHLMLISRGDAATCLLNLPQIKETLNNPIIMLKSNFKEDIGRDHSYQQLSMICEYMMTGRQLILKDFDGIYGALYDMLNQTYLIHKKRKCRVALGNAAKLVEVHEKFKCIMIEEERDIKHSDPPRLNRCEKQCIAYNDVLQDLGKENYVDSNQLLIVLETYCQRLVNITSSVTPCSVSRCDHTIRGITVGDTFLGFTEDTCASLLLR